MNSLSNMLEKARIWYSDRPDMADKMVGGYSSEGVDNRETAAWVATARVVLNMDEFVTRE